MIRVKIDILQQKENKPLGRKEIEFRVDHVGATTPSRLDVKTKLVALLNADPACVVITVFRTRFGHGMSEGSARVYSSAEMLKRTEAAYVLARHEPKKKKEAEPETEVEPKKEAEPEAKAESKKKKEAEQPETEAEPKKTEAEPKKKKKEAEQPEA